MTKKTKTKKAKSLPFKARAHTLWKDIKKNLLPATLSTLLILVAFLTYQLSLVNKYYPFIYVGDTNLTYLTKDQAKNILEEKFNQRTQQKINFDNFTIDLATSEAKIDLEVLDEGFKIGRSGSTLERLISQINTLVFKKNLKPHISLNLDNQLDTISFSIQKIPQNAQLIFNEITTPEGSPSADIQIKEGVGGFDVDKSKVIEQTQNYLLSGKTPITLPTKVVEPTITTKHVFIAKKALEDTQKQPIQLKFDGNVWVVDTKQLLALLDLQKGEGLLDKEKTNIFLEKIAQEINQDVKEALFEFNPNTKRVSAFSASQEGRRLDVDKTYQALTEALENGQIKNITLPVEKIMPKIQTSDVNSLGISELIGRGVSNFAGSIPNRAYNVNLTAQKLNGVLIPPGEIFSFLQTVGDITAATGYKQAYVIKGGRTVLDDGGGVCQDSTTLFRAALNAGLPIIKRTAHAYRVSYYEQGFPPGLDATIFYPSVDLQFKNDTSHHILLQAYTVGATLYVDLYGTSDGRKVTLSTPIISSQTPPPPELRQDDPNLPKGEVKQVDFPAWGANVSFTRKVEKDGQEIINETWRSNYKAWQAVYLVGTKEN